MDSAFATVAGDGASINDKIGSVGLLPPEIANERLEASDMLYFITADNLWKRRLVNGSDRIPRPNPMLRSHYKVVKQSESTQQ